jgi:hypothetical protein
MVILGTTKAFLRTCFLVILVGSPAYCTTFQLQSCITTTTCTPSNAGSGTIDAGVTEYVLNYTNDNTTVNYGATSLVLGSLTAATGVTRTTSFSLDLVVGSTSLPVFTGAISGNTITFTGAGSSGAWVYSTGGGYVTETDAAAGVAVSVANSVSITDSLSGVTHLNGVVTTTPEPATFLAMGTGLVAVALLRRKFTSPCPR